MAKKDESAEVVIQSVNRETVVFHILGTTPLLMNRMAAKAKRELLMPRGRKNAAEKASSLKHDPYDEYRNSVYRTVDPDAKTFLAFPASGFKGAMETAALDLPGSSKSQIGRLVRVEGELIEVYGTPKLRMDVVVQAGMSKAPDVRTRAILEEWACVVAVSYTVPLLKRPSVINLLAAAGIQSGIGDGRQEKGWGSFGSFMIVEKDDEKFKRIVKSQGRASQIKALEEAPTWNDETEELMSWYGAEIKRRGFKVAA